MTWQWRKCFLQLFLPLANNASNVTAAMHALSDAIPHAAASGVLQLPLGVDVAGSVFRWKSETSPMRLSPEQVTELGGGSCTGTAVVMAAAARSIGIPARITGCSQSILDDDHHWIEFYDPSGANGPFADGWHTKEGTSAGNEGGPWDSPSGPMNLCLKKLVARVGCEVFARARASPCSPPMPPLPPRPPPPPPYAQDPARLNTVWSSTWSSQVYLPFQWSPEQAKGAALSFVGAVNRCGAYCSAWGCGENQTEHWKQEQCGC